MPQQLRECARGSPQYIVFSVLLLYFFCVGLSDEEAQHEGLKPPLSVWIRLHRLSSGPASQCTTVIFVSGPCSCRRDAEQRRSLTRDGSALINEMDQKGAASGTRYWYKLPPHPASLSLSCLPVETPHRSPIQTVIFPKGGKPTQIHNLHKATIHNNFSVWIFQIGQ